MFETQSAVRALWTVLVMLGIWLVVSIPAYAALSVWVHLRATLAAFTQTFSAFVIGAADHLRATGAGIRAELQQRLRWFEIDASAKAAWLDSVDRVWKIANTNAA